MPSVDRSILLAEAAQPAGLLPSLPHASLDHSCPARQLGAIWNLQSRPLGQRMLTQAAPGRPPWPQQGTRRPQPVLLPGSPASSLCSPRDPAKAAQSCGRQAGELSHSVPGAPLAPLGDHPTGESLACTPRAEVSGQLLSQLLAGIHIRRPTSDVQGSEIGVGNPRIISTSQQEESSGGAGLPALAPPTCWVTPACVWNFGQGTAIC